MAAAGLPVAKHGNVGVTSKSGSADVLRALGVKVDLPPERVREIFDEIGLCFYVRAAASRRNEARGNGAARTRRANDFQFAGTVDQSGKRAVSGAGRIE